MHVSERAGVHPHDGARARHRAAPTRASRRARRLGHKHVGVWVGERKIASVGVHISHGVSSHGFAVNVDNDLDPFTWVVACGLPEVQMTSMAGRGRRPSRSRASASARRYRFSEAFGRRQRLVTPDAARHRDAGGGVVDVGLAIFLTGDGVSTRACSPSAAEAARLRVADGHRAHAHPGLRRDGGPQRRPAGREVPAHARSVRGARVRGRGDRER